MNASHQLIRTEPADDAWHRDIRQFYRYWLSLRIGDRTPTRQSFDPAAVVRLLPSLWMLEAQMQPFRLKYRLVGTAVVASHHRELTGQWMDEAHPHLEGNDAYFKRYRSVIESGLPSWRKGAPYTDHDRSHKTIENMFVPLFDETKRANLILCLTRLG